MQFNLCDDDVFILYDFETTGLFQGALPVRIVQVGSIAYRVKDGKACEMGVFSSLVDPEISITDGAVAVHGITNAKLSTSNNWSIVGRKWMDWVISMRTKRVVLAGFNSNMYDCRVLEENNSTYKLKCLSNVVYGDFRREFSKWPCPGRLVEWYLRYCPDGSTHREAHDAVADCRMILEILQSPSYNHCPWLMSVESREQMLCRLSRNKTRKMLVSKIKND